MERLSRAIAITLLIIWLLVVGLIYHAPYPKEMIDLSGQPLWRLLLVGGVVTGAYWCPQVGLLAALAVILYLSDLRALTAHE